MVYHVAVCMVLVSMVVALRSAGTHTGPLVIVTRGRSRKEIWNVYFLVFGPYVIVCDLFSSSQGLEKLLNAFKECRSGQ